MGIVGLHWALTVAYVLSFVPAETTAQLNLVYLFTFVLQEHNSLLSSQFL